jgi:hypothetical protein
VGNAEEGTVANRMSVARAVVRASFQVFFIRGGGGGKRANLAVRVASTRRVSPPPHVWKPLSSKKNAHILECTVRSILRWVTLLTGGSVVNGPQVTDLT